MSSKYEKEVQIRQEEEGTYHRREYELSPARKPTTTTTYHSSKPETVTTTTTYYPSSSKSNKYHNKSKGDCSSSDEDNFEEWTTTKTKVNHKTRQVETRVSRQLLVEDGRVIADSGPQVTTRIKEDNKIEEREKEKAPKNKSKFEALESAQEVGDGKSMGRVLGEKKEIQRVSREVREENMQYHDERFKELTGHDVHRKAIQAPHELITITDTKHAHQQPPRGKMVHYSNKGKKYEDTDEILEVAKLAIDGSITKEVKRTKHHQEIEDDEKPDEKGEAEELRKAPTVTRSSRRHFDYVNDFDDTSTPSVSSDDEIEETHSGRPIQIEGRGKSHRLQSDNRSMHSHRSSGSRRHHHHASEESFPKYKMDPLLNSIRDEDYQRPIGQASSGRHAIEHRLERKDHDSTSVSSNENREYRAKHRHQSPYSSHSNISRSREEAVVEIPAEYRANKERLMRHKSGSGSVASSKYRERSFSPAQKSHLSHKSSSKSVQARLTDEDDDERKSINSASTNSHQKLTRNLQRQSTKNSKRNYYFGGQETGKQRAKSPSSSSASSSSFSDPKEQLRKDGARSKDSGFRSPHKHNRTMTPTSGGESGRDIYAVSGKSRTRMGAASPTPSAGQRSVKTTTTTLSAGLTDRPNARLKRDERAQQSKHDGQFVSDNVESSKVLRVGGQNFSASTMIRIPYRQVDVELDAKEKQGASRKPVDEDAVSILTIEAEEERRKFMGNIEQLKRRLDNISISSAQDHFNYKTVVANVKQSQSKLESAPTQTPDPKQQVVECYNVRLIQHDLPFMKVIEPSQADCSSIKRLSNELTRLELSQQDQTKTTNIHVATSDLGSSALSGSDTNSNYANFERRENNNEPDFILKNYTKQKPATISTRANVAEEGEEDRESICSSSSLKSSRTYHIRKIKPSGLRAASCEPSRVAQHVDSCSQPESDSSQDKLDAEDSISSDDGETDKKPAAWIFDPTDGSSKRIRAPVREKPEEIKIDAKTEELAESRGGKSYYIELIEKQPDAAKQKPLEAPEKPLPALPPHFSRWRSMNVLSKPAISKTKTGLEKAPALKAAKSSKQLSNPKVTQDPRKSRQGEKPDGASRERMLSASGSVSSSNLSLLKNRSKSSFCLSASSSSLACKPSKYSIYGGLKKPDSEGKPVPRLSYSRAIGPRLQRPNEPQLKQPSRYLKMK